MNDLRRILVLIIVLALGGTATWWWFTQPLGDTQPAATPSESETEPAAQDSLPPDMPAPTRVHGVSMAEVTSNQSDSDYAATLIEEAQSAQEMLEGAELAFNWSTTELTNNQEIWLDVCEKAEKPNPGPELTMRAPYSRGLKGFCSKFKETIGAEFEAIRHHDEDYFRERLHDTSLDGIMRKHGKSRPVDALVADLSTALERLDEFTVMVDLFFLVFNELIEPPIHDERIGNSYVLYSDGGVYVAVGLALMCQEVGGCRGQNHPYVLRLCTPTNPYRPGVFCYRPTDIFDAIYQTQTPIEHSAFWSMFNQVNALLVAHRRR